MRSAWYRPIVDRPSEGAGPAGADGSEADAVTNGFEGTGFSVLDYPVCLADPASCELSRV